MTRASEPLSAVDAAWLRMDRPTNRMMITALLVLQGRLERAALERALTERLLGHPRFRQHVVAGPLGRPRWAPDPHFALASHLHEVGLPPGGEAALRALVGDLMSTPLDRARPLWAAHIVDGYGEDTALVVRIHHCIADGVALVKLLLSLTDHEAPAEAAGVGRAPPPPTGLLGRLGRALGTARALADVLALPPDPPTALLGPLGVRKRVAWSRPAELGAIARAARAEGGTVNDLLLAAVAGALRAYLTARMGAPPTVEVRALVPVNLRRVVGGGATGNRFGLVYVPLPLTHTTPAARLGETRRRMDAIKASPQAVMAFGLLGALGLASVMVERFGVELFTRKATALVTSVPGPSAPVRLAGRRLVSMDVWAPASGQVGVTLSLLSYAGSLRLGVASDEHLVPDPEAIAAAYDDELARLVPRPTAPPAALTT